MSMEDIVKDAYRGNSVVEVKIQPVEKTPAYWRAFDDGVASEKAIQQAMTRRYIAAFVATLFITLLVANFAIQLHWI